jgi:hypothetical protein
MIAMTIGPRDWIAVMVVAGAGTAVNLYAGILAGLCEDWMRMSFSLFTFTLIVFVITRSLTTIRLKDRLTRVEDRFHVGREPAPAVIRRIGAAVGIFLVLSVASNMGLAVVAGLRANWFRMGIHLTACAVSAIISEGILHTITISTRLARLEQLPAGTAKAKDA